MDGHQFDRIAKSLFVAVSRRGTLGALAGLAAVGGTALGWRGAGAQEEVSLGGGVVSEDNDPTCKGEKAINNKVCPSNQCTRDRECFCTKTVNDQKRCVRYNNQVLRCPTRDECDRNKDCRQGQVCVKVGGCCGNPTRHKCVALC